MKPAKNRQKDKDARWTKKHGKSFYGYKNHVNADAKHKLIRRYDVSDAAVHDSQKLDALLTKDNTSDAVFGDSAYRSAETEATLKAQGFKSRIHVRAARGHPLSKAKAEANRKKSRLRARVEHVFGAQQTSPGGRIVRTIGIVRARAKSDCRTSSMGARQCVTRVRVGRTQPHLGARRGRTPIRRGGTGGSCCSSEIWVLRARQIHDDGMRILRAGPNISRAEIRPLR
jgi:IS5 family transposase